MKNYIALLRAVNVGGTGKLPMSDLKAMCESAGYGAVRTYIASGNVVFTSSAPAAQVKSTLESLLAEYAGQPVGVLVRSGEEMAQVLADNPFPEEAPNRTVAIFLDTPPPGDTMAMASGQKAEKIALGAREIYVFYGEGIGDSKLKLPAAKEGTARNMNTVAKLVEMALT
ncbi:MAG: DUF1697 domain-containing protein [Bdellovibrionales bacterium]|nr:DUF1697 domain-containing protein [Massilia sp.]